MSRDDVEYYCRRAVEERGRAANAETPEAANAHQQLARHYETLVANADLVPLKRVGAANQSGAAGTPSGE